MRKTILSAIVIFTLLSSVIYAETITVDGNAFLRNRSDHNSIKVVFERIAPSSLSDTTSTNMSGYFSIEIETGIYNVTYSKEDFYGKSVESSLYSNTIFDDFTLSTMLEVPYNFKTIQSSPVCI